MTIYSLRIFFLNLSVKISTSEPRAKPGKVSRVTLLWTSSPKKWMILLLPKPSTPFYRNRAMCQHIWSIRLIKAIPLLPPPLPPIVISISKYIVISTSPYNITTCSNIQIMSIKETIPQDETLNIPCTLKCI